MPKLKTHTIAVNNAAGERFSQAFEIHVTSHGSFRARLPADLVDDADFMSCLNVELADARASSKPRAFISKERIHTYLESAQLDALHEPLQAAMKRYVAVEVTEELVILYDTQAKVRFCLTADGRASQNGYTAGDGYQWPDDNSVGGSSSRGEPKNGLYTVGLWARAYVKTTSSRGDKKVIRYTRPNVDDELSTLGRLNAFIDTDCQIAIQGDAVRSHYGPGVRAAFSELPFTDEAADFFTRMLLSMCELARRMDAFFSDKERLQFAIASGAQPLLSAPEVK